MEVPGLAEKRPSVLVGDSVHVRIQRCPDQWFQGRVFVLRELEVGMRFHHAFNIRPGDLCEARFSVNRIPLRRMHQALDCPFFPDRVLFPNASHLVGLQRPTQQQLARLSTVNPLIATNPPQLEAVTAIVNRPPGSAPFVIYGPYVFCEGR